MKEMVYSTERKREVLDTGYCFGILYYILNLGTHPTAYVKIPKTHWLYNKKDYDEVPVECHYGLTYMEDSLTINDETEEKVEGKFIGWDYSHCDDYYGANEKFGFQDMGKKWTTEEIYKEVRDVCSQIIALDKCSPADQMFEKEGYAKIIDNEFETDYCYSETIMGDTFFNIIKFAKVAKIVISKNEKDQFFGIGVAVLKAINEKAKELGWYD